MAEEKERSADSLPHWFYFILFFLGSFSPNCQCVPSSDFYDLKHRWPHVGNPHRQLLIAKVNLQSQARGGTRAVRAKQKNAVIVPLKWYTVTTCSAFHSLHFTDGPSHSVVSSSSTVQVQSSPGGWSTYLLEDSPFFFFAVFVAISSSCSLASLSFFIQLHLRPHHVQKYMVGRIGALISCKEDSLHERSEVQFQTF